MNARSTRAVRGAAIAAFATVIAATAHTIGGGSAPSPLFCLALFALATPVATALASARPSLWRTTLAAGASQAMFHGAFSVFGELGTPVATAAHTHAHGGSDLTWAMDAAAAPHVDMTLAHVLAGLVTIAVIRRGEAIVSAILRWFVGAAADRAAVTFPAVPRRVASRASAPRARTVVPPGLGRRGPPAFVTASSPL